MPSVITLNISDFNRTRNNTCVDMRTVEENSKADTRTVEENSKADITRFEQPIVRTCGVSQVRRPPFPFIAHQVLQPVFTSVYFSKHKICVFGGYYLQVAFLVWDFKHNHFCNILAHMNLESAITLSNFSSHCELIAVV